MKKLIFSFIAFILFAPILGHAEAIPGKKAPDFELKDGTGKTYQLSDYSGKWVVLEWFNKDCPYVKKHYSSSNMQKLQKTYTSKGVVWLSIVSSAKGKQGYLEPDEAVKLKKENKSQATALLLDPEGTVGKSYDAKTTPHLFVIDPKGIVAYAGAIDDNNSSDPEVIPTSKNYVQMALDSGMAGKKIETSTTRSYGCGVKY